MKMRGWILGLISVLCAAPAPAAVTPDAMISAFRSICLHNFGDLGQIRNAARAAGFRPVPIGTPLPQSLLASRGELFLVYRGAADRPRLPIPQCHVEMAAASDVQFEALTANVANALGLGQGTAGTTTQARYTNWAWHDASNHALQISLSAQTLAGEPRLLLNVAPVVP